jgi:hypothetical protein
VSTARSRGSPDVASRHIVTGGGPVRGTHDGDGDAAGRCSVTFELPVDGQWTLAIAACAVQVGSDASNRSCGTWSSNVEVLD